jgi:hypothetical protein
MIELDQLEEMFSQMRAQTEWDVDGDMLWGYFFTDPDASKLEQVARELASQGYRIVGMHETDDGTHVLHVEKVETHSPYTLHERNAQFYKLADEFALESYDGMDVGPTES